MHETHALTRPRSRRIPPPPAENRPRRHRQIMWRAAESAAIEKRRRRLHLCARRIFLLPFHIHHGSPTLVNTTIHRRARLLTIALYSRYTSNCFYSLVVVRFSMRPCCIPFHIDQ